MDINKEACTGYTIIAENGTFDHDTSSRFGTIEEAQSALRLMAGALACLTSKTSNSKEHFLERKKQENRFLVVNHDSTDVSRSYGLPEYTVTVEDIIIEADDIIDKFSLMGIFGCSDSFSIKVALREYIIGTPNWLDHYRNTVLRIYSGLGENHDKSVKINFASAYANAKWENQTDTIEEVSRISWLRRVARQASRASRKYDEQPKESNSIALSRLKIFQCEVTN